MSSLDRELSALAARQHGVVHRRQLLALGLTPRQIERRLEAGILRRVHHGVYVTTAAAPSDEQALMAACLGAGPNAVVSHRSAAWLWAFRGVERPPVEITVPGERRPELSGVVVHRSRRLKPVDVTRRRRIPVTAPARTLVDLATTGGEAMVEAALDDALVRGLVTAARLERALDRGGRHGRTGAALLGRLLAVRDPSTAPTESQLELALLRALRAHRVPEPVRQHGVTAPGGARFRIDLAYPDLKVAIEADGRRWHAGAADTQRDLTRANLLVHMGWRVLRFTWADVTRRPGHVAEAVMRELRTPLPFAG